MLLRSLSRDEVRRLDVEARELGLPTLILMENAGRGAAGWLAELVGAVASVAGGRPCSSSTSQSVPDSPHGLALPKVLVLCGPGNNGGDGGVVARHLNSWGFKVRVIWFAQSSQIRGDAAVHWTILAKSGVEQSAWFDEQVANVDPDISGLEETLGWADWLVDGLLGTGLSRPVEGPLRQIIEATNRSEKPILALDLPSGLDTDSGRPLGVAVRAAQLPRSWRPNSALALRVPRTTPAPSQ